MSDKEPSNTVAVQAGAEASENSSPHLTAAEEGPKSVSCWKIEISPPKPSNRKATKGLTVPKKKTNKVYLTFRSKISAADYFFDDKLFVGGAVPTHGRASRRGLLRIRRRELQC